MNLSNYLFLKSGADAVQGGAKGVTNDKKKGRPAMIVSLLPL